MNLHRLSPSRPVRSSGVFTGNGKSLYFRRLMVMTDSPVLLSFLCFSLFFLLRSQHFAGDGGMISRITEGGKWLVKNELLSQALLQLIYRIGRPWYLTPLEIMNGLSCLCGAASIYVVLKLCDHHFGLSPSWPLLMFFSTAFLIYSCGHTEYYPILLLAMFLYAYETLNYLTGDTSALRLTLLFTLASGIHFAMVIALPSLLLLPWLKGRARDWRVMIVGLTPFILFVFIRNYPQWVGYKAASLSPAWNFLPWFPSQGMNRYYAFFEWGHWLDWLYSWTLRSWIVWPALFWFISRSGVRSLGRPDRLFLSVYALGYTVWSFVWHPDLGIEADWDLFALETAPTLLLALSYLPDFHSRPSIRFALAIVCLASIAIGAQRVWMMADLPRQGYGALEIQYDSSDRIGLTIDGLSRNLDQPRLHQGFYSTKLIDRDQQKVHDMFFVILPGYRTVIQVETGL